MEDSATDVDICIGSLASTENNLDDFNYIENNEETISLPDDEKMLIDTEEQLNELS